MIYEARVTGKYGTRYWVQIPTKYGQQDVGPIKATGLVSPSIGQIVYVGYLPTADTFVILAGPEGAPVVSWGDIADKPSTFTPSAHNHSASNITSGTLSSARLPVVTSSANGAMLAADKVKLDAATLNSTADTIAMRDGSGRLATQTPTGPTHAANKTYVDGLIASHSHVWSDLPEPIELDGTTDFNTLTTRNPYHQSSNAEAATAPNSPSPYAGYLYVENKGSFVYQWYYEYGSSRRVFYRTKYNTTWYAWRELIFWDSASMTTSNSSLVQRTAAGNIYGNVFMTDAAQSTASNALTRKDYVDAQVATRAASSHTHAWSEITSKPSTFTPSAHTHDAADTVSGTFAAARLPVATQTVHGAMSAADKVKLDGAGYDAGPSRLLMTSSSDFAKAGAFFVSLAQQTQAHALTRKDYVDGLASGLQSSKLDKALIEIGDAADLNTYTTTGDYHQSASARAGNGTNYPAALAGKLEVKASDSGTFVYQEYTAYNSTARKFYRCKYGSTWYAWKEVGVRTAPAVWSSVSINTTNFTLYDSASYAQITEDNGLVTLSAVLKPTSAGVAGVTDLSGAHALTIPAQYLPASTKSLIWVMQASGREHVTGSLEADGRFTIGRHTATPSTSTWLPIYVQWRL